MRNLTILTLSLIGIFLRYPNSVPAESLLEKGITQYQKEGAFAKAIETLQNAAEQTDVPQERVTCFFSVAAKGTYTVNLHEIFKLGFSSHDGSGRR